jgi:hypothetical protein
VGCVARSTADRHDPRPSGYETFDATPARRGFGMVEQNSVALDHLRSAPVGKPRANGRTSKPPQTTSLQATTPRDLACSYLDFVGHLMSWTLALRRESRIRRIVVSARMG